MYFKFLDKTMSSDIRNPRNAGRKRKEAKDKVRPRTIYFSQSQDDFVVKNGGSELIRRLVDDVMRRSV